MIIEQILNAIVSLTAAYFLMASVAGSSETTLAVYGAIGSALGTGSGVLSILALMFGAKHAVGTDLDKCAVPAVKENMENNGISADKFDMMIGNIIDDKEVQDKVGYDKYDIVVANILANVLVPLTPVILNQLKSGGIYITSGIINTKEEEVKKAHLDAGLEILEIHHQGDWVSITSTKN